MLCILLCFSLLPSIYGINQPHNSRISHRGLRSNVYLPPTIRLSNPHTLKEKYCGLLRANGSTTVTKIPVTMTLGKIFHYVTMEVFDTFYRTGCTGSLSIQRLSRNASIWSRLRYYCNMNHFLGPCSLPSLTLTLSHTTNTHPTPQTTHPYMLSARFNRLFLPTLSIYWYVSIVVQYLCG